MSGLDENRLRNSTISFHVSPEECIQLEARIKVSGMPKGEYFIQSLLYQELNIAVVKYKSDRLSLEFKKICEALEMLSATEEIAELLKDCKALLTEMLELTNDKTELSILDFKTKKMS